MARNSAKAIEDYRKALECDPDNYHAMENLAGIYERTPETIPLAIDLYRRALQRDPRAVWQENLAVWIKMLRSRDKPEDRSAAVVWRRGNDLLALGNTEEAESQFTRSIELDAGSYHAYFSRGLIRLRRNDLQAALSDFDEVIKAAPEYVEGLIYRGLVLETMGRIQQAASDLQRAGEIAPGDYRAHYQLGRLQEMTGQYENALKSYEHALRPNLKPEVSDLVRERIAQVKAAIKSRPKSEHKASPKTKTPW
jgi:tetratricopeptide (TPR) repeat protein